MNERRNIMKAKRLGMARGMGMMVAGFLSMLAGLTLGSVLADARTDRTPVMGMRRSLIMHIAQSGPEPLRRAGMAAMADGVLTVREERHLYLVVDQMMRERSKPARIEGHGGIPRYDEPHRPDLI